MEIDDEIKSPAPNIQYKPAHFLKRTEDRAIPQRNAIDRDNLVNCRAQFGNWGTPMSCEKCQAGIRKSALEGSESRKQQDHISQPCKTDRENVHGKPKAE